MAPVARAAALILVVLLASGADAFRVRHKGEAGPSFEFIRRRRQCPKFEPEGGWIFRPGRVAALYTFGAPGTASPGLQDQNVELSQEGHFKGVRTWSRWLLHVDIVTSIASAVWLWHPYMRAESIEIDNEVGTYGASMETTQEPSSLILSVDLHWPWNYWNTTAQRDCDGWQNWSMLALNVSYEQVPGHAARLTEAWGWGLIGSAFYDGSAGILGGPQVSHLLQHPETQECVLTFQGSAHRRDWYSNLAFLPAHFCGLVEEDEECSLFGFGTCMVRNPRGSFVHGGFAETARRMVRTDDWQTNIRSKLPWCAAVYATGHSLGGAVAALFAACVSRPLSEGDYGYDDYKLMGWDQEYPWKFDTIAPLPNPWPQ